MPTRYSVLSIDPIEEDSEDDARRESKSRDGDSQPDSSYHHSSSTDVTTYPSRTNMGKERERSRRQHRGKHSHRSKNPSSRKTRGSSRERSPNRSRTRHRRTSSNRSCSSPTSSDDEEEPIQDHRQVLAAARAQLTSPSMISAFTTLTTATNQSSGSSGSNSTVTQSSVSKRSVGKQAECSEDLISPAVPDAPDVFEFLEEPSQELSIDREDESEEGSDEEHHEGQDEGNEDEGADDGHDSDSQWPTNEESYLHSSRAPILTPDTSSSGTSSLHGSDHFSETPADHDTDRSTSPESSVKDHVSDHEAEPEPPSPASIKFASQLAAAQQRQNAHIAMQNLGAPNVPRRDTMYHYMPTSNSTAISPAYQQHMSARPLPRAEKVPVTGYELLASRLSSHAASAEGGDESKIKPMYRKFEALNHRLLLHLQDEISELEEQLHRLDSADTQSRRAGADGSVLPASRRAAQAAGGELQWHKTDILGRIGFKLAQYNQALAAFHATSSLTPPAPTDITAYRDYLHTTHPIAEVEARFLDPADDLVSVCSSVPASVAASQTQTLTHNMYSAATLKHEAADVRDSRGKNLTASAISVAVAVLIPVLTFPVIPGFLGRLTVTCLVVGGVMGSLIQAGVLTAGQLLEREGLLCGGIYLGGMAMIATVMA